ncbi:hypothetical protein [Lutibacter maritimus]|uniref:Uncharacterized protein n=1 Tax=Lutibacter maritimus TaxID=593133 RepID=A0A1I6SLB8_9FLAO|nr:hypothetical protein [Lutibacter maritimus]SFS77568.1 hypothetical protein SAMN04488006_3139 [Lutibacter maritimus]
MELLEKKKRAAAIAVSLYLQNEDNNENEVACCNWSKMGMNRKMNDREFLFKQGKTIGVRIF